jgi:hypothetical protein
VREVLSKFKRQTPLGFDLKEVRDELIIRNLGCVGMNAKPPGDTPLNKRLSLPQRRFANQEGLRGRIVKGFKISVRHLVSITSLHQTRGCQPPDANRYESVRTVRNTDRWNDDTVSAMWKWLKDQWVLGLSFVLAIVLAILVRAIAFCEPNCYLHRLFDAPNLPSVLLVLVGIGGVWAALRTLTAIEKQVDAMVNSERAWMQVDLGLGPNPAVIENTSGAGPVFTFITVSVKWLNVGRTPAWINLTQIGLMILPDEINAPASLPEAGDLSIIGPEMVGADKVFAQTGTVKALGRITRENVGLIYGKVSYFDIFRIHHTTTFGFFVQEDRRIQRLPFVYPVYNEHT